MQTEYLPENNSYAYSTRNGERRIIYIDNAESGKKGYVCIGCGQEMIAYNLGKYERRHYFGHDPKDVDHKGQCTFSNETYRHYVAKMILQRIKRIQVPAVFVYPPDGSSGRPQKIRGIETIEAATVGIEYVFFENEQGVIQYCPRSEWYVHPKRYLLIQPDVTFFDKMGIPILLIEVVATHKIDDEKKFKLKCLGLNTVTVNIPKSLPEVIEQSFFSTQQTKWAYNHEQATTVYIQVPGKSSISISSVDELPDEFHEETYRCRTTQIGGLIRALEKNLAGEPYRNIEKHLREEQSRVSTNTERDSQRLRNLQTKHEGSIRDEFRERLQQLNAEQESENTYFENLERRYQSKKAELIGEEDELAQREENYIQRWKSHLEGVEAEIASLEKRIDEFRNKRGISSERGKILKRQTTNIEQQIADIEEQIANTERETTAIEYRRATLPESFKRSETDLEREFERKEVRSREDTEREKNSIEFEFNQAEQRIRSNHSGFREQANDAIREQTSRRAPRLAGRMEELFKASELISFIREKECYFRRLQTARKWAKARAWREWTKH
ncbi:hypothetical protein [Larkinella punicea]|uniref:hypothetical protein n=1 Tax=Larkinella punicea TaxID=2315727 RepID=UPI0010587602|nr:hypothetical protein [Larkinella punicea]